MTRPAEDPNVAELSDSVARETRRSTFSFAVNTEHAAARRGQDGLHLTGSMVLDDDQVDRAVAFIQTMAVETQQRRGGSAPVLEETAHGQDPQTHCLRFVPESLEEDEGRGDPGEGS